MLELCDILTILGEKITHCIQQYKLCNLNEDNILIIKELHATINKLMVVSNFALNCSSDLNSIIDKLNMTGNPDILSINDNTSADCISSDAENYNL